MDNYRKKLYLEAVVKWGIPLQIGMYHEESAELTIELNKTLRTGKVVKPILIDEIVDVEIMLEQIRVMFEITDEECNKHKLYKLERLEKRLCRAATTTEE